MFLSALSCPLPVSATAQQECQEMPGDLHVIASRAPTAGGEEQLPGAAQGVGTSVQIRNAAGQTLPSQVLLFGGFCFLFG